MVPSTKEIEASVQQTIVAVLVRNERDVPNFSMHDDLMATGLGSSRRTCWVAPGVAAPISRAYSALK